MKIIIASMSANLLVKVLKGRSPHYIRDDSKVLQRLLQIKAAAKHIHSMTVSQ